MKVSSSSPMPLSMYASSMPSPISMSKSVFSDASLVSNLPLLVAALSIKSRTVPKNAFSILDIMRLKKFSVEFS